MELDSYLDDFQAHNTEIIAVTSDKRPILEATLTRLELTFPILADPDLRLTILYGVLHPMDFLPRPAVFVIDRSAKIRYRYIGQDVHDRPPAEALLEIIKRL